MGETKVWDQRMDMFGVPGSLVLAPVGSGDPSGRSNCGSLRPVCTPKVEVAVAVGGRFSRWRRLRTCQTIPEGALEQSASTCVSRLRNPLTWAHPTLTWMPERGRPLHRISHVGSQANNDMCNHETMSKQRGRQVECWLCPCFPFYIVKLLPSTVHNVTSISSSVRAARLGKMIQNGEHVFGDVLVFKNT